MRDHMQDAGDERHGPRCVSIVKVAPRPFRGRMRERLGGGHAGILPAQERRETRGRSIQLRDRDSNPKFDIQSVACCQLHHPGRDANQG